MPNIKWLSVLVLSVALSGAAFAAGRGGGGGHGGGGGGGRGGGGGFHGGGGGGFHGGGGGFHGGGAHFGGGGGHFGGVHGGGARVGGGHFGGGHFAGARGGGFHGGGHLAGGGRHVGGAGRLGGGGATAHAGRGGGVISHAGRGGNFGGAHSLAGRNGGNNRHAAMRANAVHHALAGAAVAGALHNRGALHNPASRAHISAAAATAGWRGHDRQGGWWRHGNGGYGWVGPLFWPFAYDDMSDYAMWGYGPSFWDYGYGDLYAGIFAPYGYDDLAGYLPYGGGYAGGGYAGGGAARSGAASSSGPAAAPNELTQMCGQDTQEIAGLPIDRIQQAINPDDDERKALDDLANASVKAAQIIKDACPSQVASTAPGRLAAMQTRLEAMISAVNIVQPPLDHFYGLLNDEQKSRLNALGEDQRRDQGHQDVLTQGCGNGQPGATDWPAAEIEQRVHPTDAQRASFNNLKDASAKAADMLKGTCEPNEALTPPARLSAAGKRLDAMLQAVETVKSALDDLYAKLSDEQKAQFESIGPGREVSQAPASDETAAPASHHHYHHRHHASVVGLVRRLVGF